MRLHILQFDKYLISTCFILCYAAMVQAGVKGYKTAFVDLSGGFGKQLIANYKRDLKANSAYLYSKNKTCWDKRVGSGFDSIKTNNLDDRYYNSKNILSVLSGDKSLLNDLQKSMANVEMPVKHGMTSFGVDGIYIFQKDNGYVVLSSIPLKGTDIVSKKIPWNSDSIIASEVFDELMCEIALPIDNNISP